MNDGMANSVYSVDRVDVKPRGWTATNMNTQKKMFHSVCNSIRPIKLLALASYRSRTNQILIFGILDLNFQS